MVAPAEASAAGKKPAEELSLLREDTGRRLTVVEERLGKLEKGVEESRKQAADAVKLARRHADDVEFYAEDAGGGLNTGRDQGGLLQKVMITIKVLG